MKSVLMTLSEAIQIASGIQNKTTIQKKAGAGFTRLNPAEINNLAGLTVQYCKAKTEITGEPVNELTREGLVEVRENFKNKWLTTRNPNNYYNQWWGKMTECEKILENWREKYELEFDYGASYGGDELNTSFLDDNYEEDTSNED